MSHGVPPSDVAFTPTVKAIQEAKGSRASYAAMEAKGGWQTTVDARLEAFLAVARSAYLATANADGQPYIQHRGGLPGFIRVLGERTVGFADYAGNKQYISMGNLSENAKAQLFLMDYQNRRRVKVFGTARMVEGDEALLEHLMPAGYRARPERALLFDIAAWDVNCPQHIPQRFEAEDVANVLAARDARIGELEHEIAVLRQQSWLKEGCAGAGDE